MIKTAMLALAALAFTACASTAPPPPPPTAAASTEGCKAPAFMDNNERYAKNNMGAVGSAPTYACGK